jgi:transcriptional regulator with XRE-family HTH domain
VSHETAARWRDLAEQLVRARKERGLKQAEVVAVTGYRQALVSGWESGGYMPNARAFIAWADALGYDVQLVQREVP